MEQTQGRPSGRAGVIKRLDDTWAHVEAALAIGMLLLMIVVAFVQAFLRNMTQQGFAWANAGLAWLDWADFILSKGTLWVAFLGASLAVHADKHVAIDIVQRFVNPKLRMLLRALVGFAGFVICIFLARAFWSAVQINGEERPARYDLIMPGGSIHVCDATAEQLAQSGAERSFFCHVRSLLALFGAHMETPGAAFQLIVPAMFAVMSLRFLGNGIRDMGRFLRGDVQDDLSEHGMAGNAHEVDEDIRHREGH
jgi:TRAP-type C4-dicarboxylate transport system permease small subunit